MFKYLFPLSLSAAAAVASAQPGSPPPVYDPQGRLIPYDVKQDAPAEARPARSKVEKAGSGKKKAVGKAGKKSKKSAAKTRKADKGSGKKAATKKAEKKAEKKASKAPGKPAGQAKSK